MDFPPVSNLVSATFQELGLSTINAPVSAQAPQPVSATVEANPDPEAEPAAFHVDNARRAGAIFDKKA